jgi:hypothetical protein
MKEVYFAIYFFEDADTGKPSPACSLMLTCCKRFTCVERRF